MGVFPPANDSIHVRLGADKIITLYLDSLPEDNLITTL